MFAPTMSNILLVLYGRLLLALPQTSYPFMNNMTGEKLIRAFNPQRAKAKEVKTLTEKHRMISSFQLLQPGWCAVSSMSTWLSSETCNDTSESLPNYCTLHISDSIADPLGPWTRFCCWDRLQVHSKLEPEGTANSPWCCGCVFWGVFINHVYTYSSIGISEVISIAESQPRNYHNPPP